MEGVVWPAGPVLSYDRLDSMYQELGEITIRLSFQHIFTLISVNCLFFYLLMIKMCVSSLEREMEVMGITTRERVLGDPDMLDIIFSYLDPQSMKSGRLVST